MQRVALWQPERIAAGGSSSAYFLITNLSAPADKPRLITDPHQFPLAVGGQVVGVGCFGLALGVPAAIRAKQDVIRAKERQ